MYKVFGSVFVLCLVLVGCAKFSDHCCSAPAQSSEIIDAVEVINPNVTVVNEEVTVSGAVHEVETVTLVKTVAPSNLVECVVKTEKGRVAMTCGRETASGVPAIRAEEICNNPSENRVDDVIAAMDKSGFDRVRAIAMCGEVVGTVEKKVSNEGKTFTYKAITYTGGCFEDRVAVYSVTNEDGTVATPLDELLLVLAGKIPFNAYGGMWFPHRTWGPAVEFGYGKNGTNVKIETVYTLADGRVIKHITQNECVPYFAIEVAKTVRNNYVITKELQSEGGRAAFPSFRELRSTGSIPSNAKDFRSLGISSTEVDGKVFATQTVAYSVTEEKQRLFVTCYPYYR